jgi:hypothetical protein
VKDNILLLFFWALNNFVGKCFQAWMWCGCSSIHVLIDCRLEQSFLSFLSFPHFFSFQTETNIWYFESQRLSNCWWIRNCRKVKKVYWKNKYYSDGAQARRKVIMQKILLDAFTNITVICNGFCCTIYQNLQFSCIVLLFNTIVLQINTILLSNFPFHICLATTKFHF